MVVVVVVVEVVIWSCLAQLEASEACSSSTGSTDPTNGEDATVLRSVLCIGTSTATQRRLRNSVRFAPGAAIGRGVAELGFREEALHSLQPSTLHP